MKTIILIENPTLPLSQIYQNYPSNMVCLHSQDFIQNLRERLATLQFSKVAGTTTLAAKIPL